MPGFDRNQERLISQTEIQGMLAQFAQVNGKIFSDKLELLAAAYLKKLKPPSVFKAGTAFDFVNSYFIFSTTNAPTALHQKWLNLASVSLDATVYVFNIQDADVVSIQAIITGASTLNSKVPLIVAYALSASSATVQIPISDFGLMENKTNALLATTTPNLFGSVHEEIQCSGYQYLHVFGLYCGNDLMPSTVSTSTSGNWLAYALKK